MEKDSGGDFLLCLDKLLILITMRRKQSRRMRSLCADEVMTLLSTAKTWHRRFCNRMSRAFDIIVLTSLTAWASNVD